MLASETHVLMARSSSEWVGPGLTALAVLVLLGIGTVLLWRSMNKQLRKIKFREESPPSDDPESQARN